MNVHQAIRMKRAVRQYSLQPINLNIARHILNCGRLAQSAQNSQPWHFLAVRDQERLGELSHMGRHASHVGDAALAVLILLPDPVPNHWVYFDAGQAAAYMQLAAQELGIGSCIVELDDQWAVRDLFGIPNGKDVHVAIAFGHPATGILHRRTGLLGRRTLDDVVRWERW